MIIGAIKFRGISYETILSHIFWASKSNQILAGVDTKNKVKTLW